jgi:hypothetical protein
VFLFRDWGLAGELANIFATYHRFTAISYRSIMAELFISAARLAARYNGIENAPHVREDITEMVLYREILDMAAKAAIELTGSLDLDTLIRAMEGMVVLSPAGARWIRPDDHQAIYDVPYGKVTHVGGEIPLLTDLVTRSAWEYYRSPPF